jgi:L-lactate dehydrogenase (cytochrome)
VSDTPNVAPVTPADYRRLAERRLPRFMFDYIDGGANDERTMAANVADYAALKLRQRVMRDVSNIDTSTTLAGESASMPVALAPVGMAGLYSRRGEVHGRRASQKAGVPFTLSTVGICSIEEIQAAVAGPYWFQLYMTRDREVVQRLLARAKAGGCSVLQFTVDLPMAGMRHRDTRVGMIGRASMRTRLAKVWQLGTRPGWIWDVGVMGKPHTFANIADAVADPTDLHAYKAWIDAQFDTSVTWKDIGWVRDHWDGKLIIKGVMEPDDARAAVDAGADGVIVSNHGGRQLDSVASSISKLPAVAAAVGERTEVYVDGGIRSGIDVLKSLALGARGVLIGRPWVWATAAAGEQGLVDLLATFKRELEVAMALTGVTRIDQIDRSVLDG